MAEKKSKFKVKIPKLNASGKTYDFSLSLPGMISAVGAGVLALTFFFVMGILIGRGYRPESDVPPLQEIMPNRMRGQATAIYFFIISLLGIGTGPTLVAMITDYVFGDPAAVRWSLVIAPTAAYVVSAGCFLWGRKPYVRSRQAHRKKAF